MRPICGQIDRNEHDDPPCRERQAREFLERHSGSDWAGENLRETRHGRPEEEAVQTARVNGEVNYVCRYARQLHGAILSQMLEFVFSALADLPPPPSTGFGPVIMPALGLSVLGIIGILIIVRRRRSRDLKP
jgi:LPXTG-motif cell wall-anchored protein